MLLSHTVLRRTLAATVLIQQAAALCDVDVEELLDALDAVGTAGQDASGAR
jgi:hypothetical protein